MKRVTLSHRRKAAVTVSSSNRLPGWLAIPYAAWAGTVFLLLAVAVLILMLPVPWQELRRRMVRSAARLALWLCGLRVSVQHVDYLPATPSVVVANHASYLDGIVLFAALPPVFGFVIKREMSRVPLANLLLRRIGSHFVDRSGAQRGARDTRKLLKRAQAGGAMAFFPEGTFSAEPGLARFRSGAFVVAANARLPIVPVAIRGTRRALPAVRPMPRPGRIEVELAPPLPPPVSSSAADVAVALGAARAAILARIPEPDLAPEG
ncbi:MAG TPA: lysophospholipid acyltransferase family protein [Steroidobacteraceae bacterium]|nr:lysophospholipid acyltransferase family protein [Steroidobacteraceae bacterium]